MNKEKLQELRELKDKLEGWLDDLDEFNYTLQREDVESVFQKVRDQLFELEHTIDENK